MHRLPIKKSLNKATSNDEKTTTTKMMGLCGCAADLQPKNLVLFFQELRSILNVVAREATLLQIYLPMWDQSLNIVLMKIFH